MMQWKAESTSSGGLSHRRGQVATGIPKLMLATARIACLLLLATALGIMFIETIAIVNQNQNPNSKQFVDTVQEGTSLVDCTVVTTPSSSNTDGTTATANGVLHITVHHDLSPLASGIFMDLVKARHFDGVFLFRVLPHFVAQFGVRHDGMEVIQLINNPSKEDKDAIHDRTLSNRRGTLSFAGGNPATKQVFVNLGDNTRLDKESRPFATVDDSAMTQVLDKLYTGYKDGSGQVKTMKQGEEATRQQFPYMSQIQTCQVIQEISLKRR